jgi:molecular chaperone GrpE
MAGDKEMDEWDALQAQIDAGGADKMDRKPTDAELRKAADDFLKQHKDVVTDEEETPFPESVMEDGEVVESSAADTMRIQELEAELATLKDQALRVRAEAENIRKRSEREVQNAKAYGVEKFAGDILSVYDNLSRALHTIDGKAKDELGDNARTLVEGIELTEKDLTTALGRHGVKPVAGVGSKFDPNVHQAVANIPHPEIEKGHVAAVMQQGFTIGERTLRAAMVAVSAGPAA